MSIKIPEFTEASQLSTRLLQAYRKQFETAKENLTQDYLDAWALAKQAIEFIGVEPDEVEHSSGADVKLVYGKHESYFLNLVLLVTAEGRKRGSSMIGLPIWFSAMDDEVLHGEKRIEQTWRRAGHAANIVETIRERIRAKASQPSATNLIRKKVSA